MGADVVARGLATDSADATLAFKKRPILRKADPIVSAQARFTA